MHERLSSNKTARRLRWLKPYVGIGTKTAILAVIGSLTVIGLFSYLGTAALSESTQHILQERVVLAQTAARHIDSYLAILETTLINTTAQNCWQDPDCTDVAIEHAYQRLSVFVSRVFLLDRAGRIIATYPPITSTVSFSHFDSVSAALDGAPFVVSRYARPFDPIHSSTIATAPIRDPAGNVSHILLVSINLTGPGIQIFTHPIGLGETGYMDLVDLNGTILASTRAERISQPSDHEGNLVSMIREHRQTVSICHDCHSPNALPRREVLAFAPLERAQWGVAVHQSEDQVLAVTRLLQTRIFALMVIVIVGALGVALWAARRVVVPIQALTAATQRIAAGDLDSPLQVWEQDEIGLLARSLDSMRVRLKDSMAEIQAWNSELNTRVQARTAECREARAEIETLYGELRQQETLLRELLHRVILTQEEERRRISRELHDETNQILTGMVYRLERANELIERGKLNALEARTLLDKLLELTHTARDGVNRIIFDLRPTMLDHLGLIPALREYAEERFDGTDIRPMVREIGEPRRLPPAIETVLFRVAQEAINNIAQHSHARHADLTFEYLNDNVEARIVDDGQGFDPAHISIAQNGHRGLGLMCMEERIKTVGGKFRLHSVPGIGTTILLSVPIGDSANVND